MAATSIFRIGIMASNARISCAIDVRQHRLQCVIIGKYARELQPRVRIGRFGHLNGCEFAIDLV